MNRSFLRWSLAAVAFVLVWPALGLAQTGTGIVDGRVIDPQQAQALPGAIVTIAGTSIEDVTDRDGRFHLTGVPAGHQTLVVKFLGRQDQTVELTVTAGTATSQTINFDQP